MKDYIHIGIDKGLISLNEDGSRIKYVYQKKDLHVILHMKCVRDTAMLYFGGSAGQQRIPASYLENFDLLVPPKEKQIEIATCIYELRQQARTLQEVERMILSEN